MEEEGQLQEILDLLVAAGYFRARVKGLSPFDKIVGGMTWCLEICNVDVDVDLLFHDNLSIGQKISLTEKIVGVLSEMECPYRLDPHQIQGLDYINIFPVVQWLVKRALEAREETGETVRTLAIFQFDKRLPEYDIIHGETSQLGEGINKLKEVYRPVRCLRREGGRCQEENEQLAITLMEYGHKRHYTEQSTDSQETQDDVSLAQTVQPTDRLSAVTVGKILRASAISEAASQYKHVSVDRVRGGRMDEEEVLVKQKSLLKGRVSAAQRDVDALCEKVEQLKEQLQEWKKRSQEAQKLTQDVEIIDGGDSAEALVTLRGLVQTNEALKKQEIQFRSHCRKQMQDMQNLIQTLSVASEAPESVSAIEQVHSQLTSQYTALRAEVGSKTRTIWMLRRKLDEVPSRAELSQYQRRLVELSGTVSSTHRETQCYFNLHNTLLDSRGFFRRELSLLQSLADGAEEALTSASGRRQLLLELSSASQKVSASREKAFNRLEEQRKRREGFAQQMAALTESQRLYYQAVSQLTEECRINEKLSTMVAATS